MFRAVPTMDHAADRVGTARSNVIRLDVQTRAAPLPTLQMRRYPTFTGLPSFADVTIASNTSTPCSTSSGGTG